ncbi:hypothetical protein [Streptomyces sp. NPDC048473]|uniref:hypothetical protein n=1 Tax=unclassified Streptomyces TaxID=2593676 RepID=UPI00371E6D9A
MRQLSHTAAHPRLDEWPGSESDVQANGDLFDRMSLEDVPDFAQHLRAAGPECEELGGKTREELLEDFMATSQEGVRVMALRHSAPRAFAGQVVPLNDHDLIEVVGRHTSRDQPGEARTQHDGLPSAWAHIRHESTPPPESKAGSQQRRHSHDAGFLPQGRVPIPARRHL